MKHVIKFKTFEEINPKDIAYISTEFDNYFTLAFEFEIETDDESNMSWKMDEFDEETLEDIIETVISDLKLRRKKDQQLVFDLAYEAFDYIESGQFNIDIFEEIFNIDKYESEFDKEVVIHLKGSLKAEILEEDYSYLKRKVKQNLPNFWRNWIRKIDFVPDATLDRGIEIKPKSYLKSVSEGISMINDFFDDFEKQNYWFFSERTGIHINIGCNKAVDWNSIKGLMLLSDYSNYGKIPLTFKDMSWRMNNDFCGSLIPHLANLPDREKKLIKKLSLHDIQNAEQVLNKFLMNKVEKVGFKNLGFNITKLKNDYVEFRYAGGQIPKNTMIEKVKYFCFIVYCMTNKEYKRQEYLKKLYKFIDNL